MPARTEPSIYIPGGAAQSEPPALLPCHPLYAREAAGARWRCRFSLPIGVHEYW
ncbi:MAG: hypothetical protein ACRD3W_27830 [Terriglobales bacterium]